MNDQFPSTIGQPSKSLAPPVKLWTPRLVGVTSFFLGFPSGIVLASINWIRMRMKEKAIWHLVGGAIATFLFTLLILLTPGIVVGLGFVVNIGALYYLYNQTMKDTEAFRVTNPNIQNASGWGGCLIGLGVLVFFMALILVMAILLAILGVNTLLGVQFS